MMHQYKTLNIAELFLKAAPQQKRFKAEKSDFFFSLEAK